MQLRHLSLPQLIETAGGDPWQVNSTLQSGNPGIIDDLARAFHNAGGCTAASSAQFDEAVDRFRAAWNRENGEHPINDALEVQRVRVTLKQQQTQLTAIGTDLENIAAALAEAQKSSAHQLHVLEVQLQDIDNQIPLYEAAGYDTGALLEIARDDTAGIFHQIEKIRDHYADNLQNSTAVLLSDGYDPSPLDSYDCYEPPDQDEQARKAIDGYGSAQREADQELLNSPGAMTPEKSEAAARLRDYATLTDSSADPESRRLAAERLDDYRMANFIGPLPPDSLMGGDARTHGRVRLFLQRGMESGLFSSGRTMTPDQATRMVDAWGIQARAWVIKTFAERLRNSGVSPAGVQQAEEAVKSGMSLRAVIDNAADATGTVGGALDKYGSAMPTGRHWRDATVFSKADAEAISKLGRRLSRGATGLDLIFTAGDVWGGKTSFIQGASEFGGRWAGGAGAAWAGAALAATLGAPEIVLPFVVAAGLIGGSRGGEKLVDTMLGF